MHGTPRQARALMVAAALLTGLLAGEARADRGFELSATDCFETVMAVPVPLERVELPEGFTAEPAGQGAALLGVAVMRCAAAVVDGAVERDVTVSDVGVMIRSPDGSEGAHFYHLWQHGDLRPLHNRMQQLGVPGKHADAELRWTDFASVRRVFEADVRIGPDSYGMDGTVSVPAGGDKVRGNPSWWHEGRYGTARLRYTVAGGVGTGSGLLQAQAGSELARLIGATELSGPVLGLGFASVDAEAGLVPGD